MHRASVMFGERSMSEKLTSTKKLSGLRVVSAKGNKRIGKVRRFVFHPTERRCIGILVKRPDAALMFHRKDLFVALDGFTVENGEVVVSDDSKKTDNAAIKALGVKWDDCVIWVGMPLITEGGELLGYVDTVTFNRESGMVEHLTTENGAANDAILGKRTIPGRLVRGFRRGAGMALVSVDTYSGEDAAESGESGAILVSDEASLLSAEGGAAAMAGKATAVVADKAKKSVAKTKSAASERVERAKPAAERAAKRTGEAVEAGAFAAGKQLGRASGMFAAFKEEYQKAARGDGDE